jgi:hypothetical protein
LETLPLRIRDDEEVGNFSVTFSNPGVDPPLGFRSDDPKMRCGLKDNPMIGLRFSGPSLELFRKGGVGLEFVFQGERGELSLKEIPECLGGDDPPLGKSGGDPGLEEFLNPSFLPGIEEGDPEEGLFGENGESEGQLILLKTGEKAERRKGEFSRDGDAFKGKGVPALRPRFDPEIFPDFVGMFEEQRFDGERGGDPSPFLERFREDHSILDQKGFKGREMFHRKKESFHREGAKTPSLNPDFLCIKTNSFLCGFVPSW